MPGWLFRPVVQHQHVVLKLLVVPPLVVPPPLVELLVVPQLVLKIDVIFQLVWPQRSRVVSMWLLRAGLRCVLRQERNMLGQRLLRR